MIAADVLVDRLAADPTDATVLEELEQAAVVYVERQTGRYFGPVKNETFVVEGTGTPRLWLPATPTQPVAQVTERAFLGATETTVLATDEQGFEQRTLGTETYLQRKGAALAAQYGEPVANVWHRGYEYVMTFQHGYAANAAPLDIREAVVGLVSAWYAARDLGGGLVVSETAGRVSRTLAREDVAQAVPGLQSTLLSWRRRRT